jgi:hypothetical protein
MDIKNAEFDADLNSNEKVVKICWKRLSMKKWQKSAVLYFYYCVQKLSAFNFFGQAFFDGFKLTI